MVVSLSASWGWVTLLWSGRSLVAAGVNAGFNSSPATIRGVGGLIQHSVRDEAGASSRARFFDSGCRGRER